MIRVLPIQTMTKETFIPLNLQWIAYCFVYWLHIRHMFYCLPYHHWKIVYGLRDIEDSLDFFENIFHLRLLNCLLHKWDKYCGNSHLAWYYYSNFFKGEGKMTELFSFTPLSRSPSPANTMTKQYWISSCIMFYHSVYRASDSHEARRRWRW